MNKENFNDYLKDLNIVLTESQKEKLELFANLLLEYNKTTNITSIRNKEDVYLKHFYDSLTLVKGIDLTKRMTVLDVGSGGGFPGIVIGIVFPNLRITLLDSNHKKTDFQNYIIDKLQLSNIETVNMRAEEYYNSGNRYDLVVARAVANMQILSELCIPFVKINGCFIAMKGDFKEEIESSKFAINYLGGNLTNIVEFNLPISSDLRNLVIVYKEKDSPKGYPRKYDHIIKRPLSE